LKKLCSNRPAPISSVIASPSCTVASTCPARDRIDQLVDDFTREHEDLEPLAEAHALGGAEAADGLERHATLRSRFEHCDQVAAACESPPPR
jgi:hypothetical protein